MAYVGALLQLQGRIWRLSVVASCNPLAMLFRFMLCAKLVCACSQPSTLLGSSSAQTGYW